MYCTLFVTAYAHANGQLGPLNEPTRERLGRAIDERIGITYEWDGLHVDGQYCRRSYDVVERLLGDLIRRALEWVDRDAV